MINGMLTDNICVNTTDSALNSSKEVLYETISCCPSNRWPPAEIKEGKEEVEISSIHNHI